MIVLTAVTSYQTAVDSIVGMLIFFCNFHTLKMIHQINFCDQVYTKGCLYFHDICWGTGMIYWCVGVYCYSEGGWVIGKSILQWGWPGILRYQSICHHSTLCHSRAVFWFSIFASTFFICLSFIREIRVHRSSYDNYFIGCMKAKMWRKDKHFVLCLLCLKYNRLFTFYIVLCSAYLSSK